MSAVAGLAQPINSPTNALGTVGLPFSYQISSTNVATNYSATGLPPGLVAPGTNGLITGLPQAAGTFASTVTALSTNATNTTNVAITINPPASPVLVSPLTYFGMQGEPFRYALLSEPSHSNVPTTFSASNLPAGATLTSNVTTNALYTNVLVTNYFINAASLATNGSFVVPVVTRNAGGTNTNSVTFVISPSTAPVISSTNAAAGIVGVPFSFDVTAINSPLRFRVTSVNGGPAVSITNGSLINGLSFSNVSSGSYVIGRISGTPATTNTVTLGLEAINNTLTSATQTLTINIGPPQPTVILSQPLGEANFAAGSSFYVNAQAFDRLPDTIVPSSVSFTADGAALPGVIGRLGEFYGVEFFPNSGLPFPFNLQVTAQNSLGQTSAFALTMRQWIPANTFPVIQMLPLLPGPQIQAGGIATLRARASTPSARTSVDRVEFYVNKVFVGSSSAVVAGTVDEYQFQWQTPVTAGAFEVSARVISQNGNGTLPPIPPGTVVPVYASVITRTPVVLNTAPGVLPTVGIISPTSGAQLPFNVATRVVAAANAFGGSIQQVQFYVDGRPLGAADNTAPYTVDFTPTSYGAYQLFAIATSSAGLINISPTVTVTVPELQGGNPTVTLSAPTSAKTGQILTFTADANDADGNIVSVEFLANGAPLPTPDAEGNANPDLVAPYRYVFAPGAPGRYELVARATDNSGNVTDSAPVVLTVTVGTPPTVGLTALSARGSFPLPRLAVVSSGTDFTFTFVIKKDLPFTLQQTTSLGNPWAVSPSTPVDDVDQTGVADGFVRKRFVVPKVPSLFFRVVYSDVASYSLNETAIFNVNASDTDGSIRQVDLVVNGVIVASLPAGPYRFNFQLTNPGLYTVVARATDNLGNISDSAPATILVTQGTPPTVEITSPKDGLQAPLVPVSLFWSANDTDGAVVQTELLVNGVSVNLTASGSGNFTYVFPSQGAYVFVARATDNLGNVTDSVPVNVTVNNSFIDPNPAVVLDPRTLVDQGYVIGSQLYFNTTAVARGANTIVADSVKFRLGSDKIEPALPTGLRYGSNTVYASLPFEIASGSPTTVRAQASDSAGNVGFSDVQSFYYANAFSPLPSVTMLTKAPGAQEVAGGMVQLQAKALFPISQFNRAAGPGTQRVEFYADGAFIGNAEVNSNVVTSNSFTHYLDWITPTNTNSYRVTARVVQLNYNVPSAVNSNTVTPYYGATISPEVRAVNTFTNEPPSIVITNPSTNGARVGVGSTQLMVPHITTATNASVREVQWYIDGLFVTNSSAFPYSYNFAPTNTGLYSLAAVVVDNFGLQGSSDARTINAYSGTPPTVSITTPKTGLVTPSATLNIAWTSNDTDGSVSQVQILVNAVVFATYTRANDGAEIVGSGVVSYVPPSQGSYTFVARATDSMGNVTDSTPVTVTVNNTAPPVLPVVNLLPDTFTDQRYVGGSQIYFNATATARGTNTILSNGVSFYLLGPETTESATKTSITLGADSIYASQLYTFNTPVTDVLALAEDSATNIGSSTIYSLDATRSPLAPLPVVNILTNLPPSATAVAGGVVQLLAKASFPAPAGVTFVTNPLSTNNNRVEFYADGAYLGIATLNTNPATINTFTHFLDWTTPPTSNSFKITARAIGLNFDERVGSGAGVGATNTRYYFGARVSPGILTVNTLTNRAPSVSITQPSSNNAQVGVGISNQVIAAVTNLATNASVKEVQFYVDGLFATNVTKYPYIYNFAPTNTGLYSLAAVVVDNFGLQGSSDVRTISAISGTPPTVTLTGPSLGLAIIGQTNRLVATPVVTQTGRNITQVEFLVNGAVLQVLTVANENNSYVYNWPVTAPGIYQLQARVTDNVGNVAVSNILELPSRTPPNVVLSAPSTSITGQTITMGATVTSPDGTPINAVEFLVDGKVVATDTTAPYAANYLPPAAGTYQLQARAVDTAGVAGFSNIISLVVSPPDPNLPTISIVAPLPGSAQLIGNAITVQAVASPGQDAAVSAVVYTITDPDNLVQTYASTLSGGLYVATFTPTKVGVWTIQATVTNIRGQTAVTTSSIVAQDTPPVPPGSNDAFVIDMYQKILGREPSPLELSTGVAQLNNGELTRAEFVLNLVEGEEYANNQNRVADFYYTLGVTPSLGAFSTRVTEVKANTTLMTGFDDYYPGVIDYWSAPPPFGATLGQVGAAKPVTQSTSFVARTLGVTSLVNWMWARLGAATANDPAVVASRLGDYPTDADKRGAIVSFLTANYMYIGGLSQPLNDAELAYQYQLKATTVRFLLGGPWQPTTTAGTSTTANSRLANLQVTSVQSLLSFIERLLAESTIVLVAPGSAAANAQAQLGLTVTNLAITAGGTNYQAANPPAVTIAAPLATTAVGTGVIDTNTGALTSITLTNNTNGYYSVVPAVTVRWPDDAFGSTATAVAQLGTGTNAGRVTNLLVTSGGSGYSTAPWVIVAAPRGTPESAPIQAVAGTLSISGGQITNIPISQPGSGYRPTNPAVLVGAPPRIQMAINGTNSFSNRMVTNSSLFTVGSYVLLTNSKPAATNATGLFTYTNTSTNTNGVTISVRAISATNGVILSESPWTTVSTNGP